MLRSLIPVKTLLAVDTRIYREGLQEFLGQLEQIRLMESVESVCCVIDILRHKQVDLLILDTRLPNMLQLVLLLREIAPDTHFILLSSHSDHELFESVCNLPGFGGIMSEESSLLNLVACVNRMFPARRYADPEVPEGVQPGMSLQPLAAACLPEEVLTSRQIRILALIESGCSNKEISRKLKIETCTVKNHVHNILQRLEVHSRCEAAALYRRNARPFARQVEQASQPGA